MQDAGVQTAQVTSTTQDAVVQTAHYITNNAAVQVEQPATSASILVQEVGIQTVHCTTSAMHDVGVLTNSLPYYISAIYSIAELPNINFPVMDPTIIIQPPIYTIHEVGVQTSSAELHNLFLTWFRQRFSLSSTEMDTIFHEVRVEEWVENIETVEPIVPSIESASTILSDFNNTDLFPLDSLSNAACTSTNNTSFIVSLAFMVHHLDPLTAQAIAEFTAVPGILIFG